MALTLIISEIDIRQESAQIYGAHAILDLKGCSLLQLGQLASIKRIKVFASYIQESWPGRIKGLHVINEPLCVHYLCHFLRSLLSEKLRERFHVYGDDIKSLQKYISPDVLPAELGGTAEPINDCEYKSYILNQEPYFEKLNQYGFRSNFVIDETI
ncbi:alpha-tocopherol transfer protein-like [Stegodyphus dumicola]|uniref:alpha-tocopherol transfer protein-like n=1 Tax=Stegodyphus dumicola TaxID=202533 RepID=UPI0015B28E6C|nr:alpha-tocopherol transfer protein-like [Stegodyphus dumicola]